MAQDLHATIKNLKGKQLAKLRQKYGLTQTQLAQALGVSRQTIIRIEQGKSTLNPKQAQTLANLIVDLKYARRAGSLKIKIPPQNIEKFKQVLLYILEKVGAKPNVGKTVLYKLLYFIDFDYYEKYGKPLMGLTYIKNKFGPTPNEFIKVVNQMITEGLLEQVQSAYFDKEQTKYLPLVHPDKSQLTGAELEIIDSVLAKYANKTARELSDITHEDIPWQVTEQGKPIDYQLAFYRKKQFSTRQYSEL